MTQKELLETLLQEIKHVKKGMPNGELHQMFNDMKEVKDDISDLKFTLLNPDNGVIVNTNKNTEYRKEMESNEKDFQIQMQEVENIKRWKESVTRALWIIFGSLVAIVARMFMVHGG